MLSIEKIYLKGINPTLPTVYDDGLSYMEAVAKLQYKVNECIEEILKVDPTLIVQRFDELRNYVNILNDGTNRKFDDITTNILLELEKVKVYVDEELENNNEYLLTVVDIKLRELEQYIYSLSSTVISPLTGKEVSARQGLQDTDNFDRTFGMTAENYDTRGISCDEFDSGMGQSCFKYDKYGSIYYDPHYFEYGNIIDELDISNQRTIIVYKLPTEYVIFIGANSIMPSPFDIVITNPIGNIFPVGTYSYSSGVIVSGDEVISYNVNVITSEQGDLTIRVTGLQNALSGLSLSFTIPCLNIG